ncbi:MAG: hypothetical protein NVSMB31_03800 [Vulcanimicrobiaceae bacterium]
MIRFDYMRSAKPVLVRRVVEMRLPRHLTAPIFALCAALSIISAAWAIEAYRLRGALAIENQYRDRFDQSRFALSRTKVLYARLEHVVVLAKEVRSIQQSGDTEAARFADIGNRLPAHVWLTSIANDATGVALAGKAANLAALSSTISGLARATPHYSPVLVSASDEDRGSKGESIHYELHLEGGAQ